jgi:hypothetical protein
LRYVRNGKVACKELRKVVPTFYERFCSEAGFEVYCRADLMPLSHLKLSATDRSNSFGRSSRDILAIEEGRIVLNADIRGVSQ